MLLPSLAGDRAADAAPTWDGPVNSTNPGSNLEMYMASDKFRKRKLKGLYSSLL